jgi:hypothetical protein
MQQKDKLTISVPLIRDVLIPPGTEGFEEANWDNAS